ncbi:MAG: iron ABC transporter ATP-binding protein [Euryarchaeota archaeon]|nr:iron ABC transporter ATP-binding protein [Euryarchaeota archaeon]
MSIFNPEKSLSKESNDEIVRVSNLRFSWGEKIVLQDISFSINNGQIVAILGKNGAGKTTLIKCLNGIQKPKVGKVEICSKDISEQSLLELSKLVSYVPQSVRTSFPMDVFDVLMLGRRPHISWRTSPEDLETVSDTLREFGLHDLAFRRFNRLSGGERQRAIIAKAVVQNPRIYLLDEPTSDLDLQHQLLIMEKVTDIIKNSGGLKSAIFAIHDINMAARFSDRVILLHEGKILADGSPSKVITQDNIATVFGVDSEITLSSAGSRMNIIIGERLKKGDRENE